MKKINSDPRDCPVCGKRGYRSSRTKRPDAFGVRFTYRCQCGYLWDVRLVAIDCRKAGIPPNEGAIQCG
jgi:hypothetical protein